MVVISLWASSCAIPTTCFMDCPLHHLFWPSPTVSPLRPSAKPPRADHISSRCTPEFPASVHLLFRRTDFVFHSNAPGCPPAVTNASAGCHDLELGHCNLLDVCSHGGQPRRSGWTKRWQGTSVAAKAMVGGLALQGCHGRGMRALAFGLCDHITGSGSDLRCAFST